MVVFTAIGNKLLEMIQEKIEINVDSLQLLSYMIWVKYDTTDSTSQL